MSIIKLYAQARQDKGKGASRRLRRLEEKVPGVVYGSNKESVSITLLHNKLSRALENEAIYASVIDLMVGDKKENVIIKDLQRHPYKPWIMHIDFQRVTAKDIIIKEIPLHFINEDKCKGVKLGGALFHNLTQAEIRCKVSHLPEFIEVDVIDLLKDQVLHLSDIKLPKGVQFTVDLNEDPAHNLPVVAVHESRVASEEPEEAEVEADEVPAQLVKSDDENEAADESEGKAE